MYANWFGSALMKTDTKQGAIITIGFVVLLIFIIGAITWANAEIDEKYQDVSPECREFIHEEETTLGNKTTTLLDCKWLIEEITPPKISVVIDDCDEECKAVIEKAITCRESNYTLEGCIATGQVERYIPDPELTEEQNELLEEAEEKYDARCNKDNPDKADTAFCNLYAERDLCERGYLESEPIQTHDFFLTSNWKLGIWTMFDYDNETALRIMNAAVEACTAQKRLQIDLGQWYLDVHLATVIDAVPNHRDLAKDIFQPIHPLELTPAVHANSIIVAEDTRCSLIQFKTTWVDYGCTPKPIQDCYMPTDEQLMNIYNELWREEYKTTPIKEIFQEKFDTCTSKVANMELKESGWYDDYINSLQPMQNKINYFKDQKGAFPLGISPTVVIISGCGSDTGDCNLVMPGN